MTKETEKQYNELRKKLKLPDFKDIDFEFEISDLEETNFLLRAIVRKIAEKLDFCSTMLEELLQPEPSNLYAMHETGFFDEDEKKQMNALYSRLMVLNRYSIEVSLANNEDEQALFINNVFNEWKTLKNELLKYVRKMKDTWTSEIEADEDVGYMG